MGKLIIEEIEDRKANRYLKSIPVHICLIIFYLIGMSPILAVVIDVIFCICASIISKSKNNRRLYRILDRYCDPEKFLIKLDKYEDKAEVSDRTMNKINLDRALALINLGEYHTAQDCLNAINVNIINKNNEVFLQFILLKISCFYGLGEIAEAEKIFEKYKNSILLSSNQYRDDIEVLIGERLFYRKEYDKCYNHLCKFINRQTKLRYRLLALYRLAMIEVRNGKKNQYYSKLKEIAERGNTLWIQREAKRYINSNIES